MKIVNANPDAVYSGAIHVQMQLPLTLEKMGYTKDFMMVDSITEADVAKIGSQLAGKGENLLWVSRYISPLENVPELDKIRMAIKKYGANYPISARHCQGWVMGIIIEEALKKTGYPCTRENLLTALEKTNVDTRGLTGGPIIFTSKDHHGPSWFKVYRWNANRQGSMPVKDWFKVETEGVAKK
jgi:branched-chain amino acid transport system substrate-binding protein